MKLSHVAFFLTSAFVFLSPLQAQIPYTTGHGDIGVGYDSLGKAFDPHWHLGEDEEFAPHEVEAVVYSTGASPLGLASALGVADGTEIGVAGSSAHQPNLGFATEELDPADWDGMITLSLTGWSGPGQFALYTTNMSGTAVVDVYFSTFNPSSSFGANSFELFPGDHQHFAFGFTAPGYYALELTWTGTHVTDGVITTSATFGFDVVPEPASASLLLLGAAVLVTTRRRRS
jgi:surface-anchored protein